MRSRSLPILILLLNLNLQSIDSQEYWVPFTEDNHWGIKDGKGNMIHPAEWDSIILDNTIYDYFDDLIIYLTDNKLGMINIKGKDVLEPRWDAIYVNPGLNYEYNVTADYKAETGYRSINYLSLAELKKPLKRNLSNLPVYFVITRKGKDIYIYDKRFKEWVAGPLSNVYVETDMFVDFGLMILEKQGKMGVIYKWGRKFTGFEYDSVSFWNTVDPLIHGDHCFLKIDGQIVKYSTNGKFDHDQANLIIPDCAGQILPYTDTRSWIYDFVIKDNNVLVTDGNSNVYCFSTDKKMQWIKEIPDVYSYSPVASSGNIIIGNYVYEKERISEEPVILPGKNIQHPIVFENKIIYMAETESSDEFESTEIPGLHDINPSMMGSAKKLICYNIDNQDIVWNRSIDQLYPSNLSFQIYRNNIIMPIPGYYENTGNYVLIFDAANGMEKARFKFNYLQKIWISGHAICLSTFCSPESGFMCDEITVRGYADSDLEKPDYTFVIRSASHFLIQGDLIFYLDRPDRIIVFDTEKGRKVKKLSIQEPGTRRTMDDPEQFRLLAFDKGKLFYLLDGFRVCSIDLASGKMARYAFYVDGSWTTFKTKEPVIQGDKIYLLDQQQSISMFGNSE